MMRVIKIGGRVQRDPRLAAAIAAQWAAARGSLCVVHGGGDAVSELQRQRGAAPRFVAGRRVTSDADIDALRMALSGSANKQLVSSLTAAGVAALGLSGEDASLLCARVLDAARFGRVGTPTDVNVTLLRTLLQSGYLPVISPLARDVDAPNGGALNVNGDDAAAAIAAALDAEELLLISDVPGVIVDGSPVATLLADAAADAVTTGIATGGMATKLRAALEALELGVPMVRIGGIDALGDPALGTMLVATPQLA
jgi:acetylglutamate kinase